MYIVCRGLLVCHSYWSLLFLLRLLYWNCCFRHNGRQEQERKTEKKMDRRPSGLVQQWSRHPVQIGDGQDEMDTFREICHGDQRALNPCSKREICLIVYCAPNEPVLAAVSVNVYPSIYWFRLSVGPLFRSTARSSRLRCLDLSGNALGDDGVSQLSEALLVNRTLRELNLESVHLAQRGCCALARALRSNDALKSLQISRNRVGDRGYYYFFINVWKFLRCVK